MLGSTIGYIFWQVLQEENPYFVVVLAALGVVCILIVLDYHFCRVVGYYARQTPKRMGITIEKRKKALKEKKHAA